MAIDADKLLIVVTAGVIPHDPDEEVTRRWRIGAQEWADAEHADENSDPVHAHHRMLLLMFRAAEADEYARFLRDPGRFNFVRTDWIWL